MRIGLLPDIGRHLDLTMAATFPRSKLMKGHGEPWDLSMGRRIDVWTTAHSVMYIDDLTVIHA